MQNLHAMMQPTLFANTNAHPIAMTKRVERREFQNALKVQDARAILPRMPERGTLTYVLSNSRLNFFSWIEVLLSYTTGPYDFAMTSWNMNAAAAQSLIKAARGPQCTSARAVLGTYFQIRDKSVYAQFVPPFRAAGGQFGVTKMHAKVFLLRSGDDHVVITASANFTTNDRQEQYTIDNDEGAYGFFSDWIDSIM